MAAYRTSELCLNSFSGFDRLVDYLTGKGDFVLIYSKSRKTHSLTIAPNKNMKLRGFAKKIFRVLGNLPLDLNQA